MPHKQLPVSISNKKKELRAAPALFLTTAGMKLTMKTTRKLDHKDEPPP